MKLLIVLAIFVICTPYVCAQSSSTETLDKLAAETNSLARQIRTLCDDQSLSEDEKLARGIDIARRVPDIIDKTKVLIEADSKANVVEEDVIVRETIVGVLDVCKRGIKRLIGVYDRKYPTKEGVRKW